MPISILLVDDNELFRKGVRAFLEAQEGMLVIGEAGSGAEALRLVAQRSPEVVLLDWQMPGMTGLEVLKALAARKATARVIIVSMHDDEVYVDSAMANGALGYVLKDNIVRHLPEAVRAAAQGEQYVRVPNARFPVEHSCST